jgi:hypothetical protein
MLAENQETDRSSVACNIRYRDEQTVFEKTAYLGTKKWNARTTSSFAVGICVGETR